MKNKLNNAPVYFTLVQIQFNALTNLKEFMSVIPPKFQSLGFPDFKEETVQQLIFSANAGTTQAAPVNVTQKIRYRFGDIAGSSMFILEENAMSFQTTSHETFIKLSDHFFAGLNVVHEVMNLVFSDRIGMRYLNAVIPKGEHETLEKYLQPQVLGLSKELGGTLSHSINETVTNHGDSQLVSRVILLSGKVGLPAEMAGQVVNLKPQFTKYDGLHAILDTDAYEIARAQFNIEGLINKLSQLHDLISNTFDVTVTPEALQTWA